MELLTEQLLATYLAEAIRCGDAEVHSVVWSYKTHSGTIMLRVGEAEISLTTSKRETILAFEQAKSEFDAMTRDAFDRGPGVECPVCESTVPADDIVSDVCRDCFIEDDIEFRRRNR